MKKAVLILLLVTVLGLTGCGAKEDGKTASNNTGKSNTEEVDQFAKEMKEKVGDSVTLPSESVTKIIAKKWTVAEGNDVYEMQTDGSGTKNDKPFTFQCGFDDENHITLQITMKDTDEKELYAISTDTTGYGINLTALDKGKDLCLLPADLEFLDMKDERAAGIIGQWADESGNTYTFKKDNTMKIKASESDSKGTYSVVKNTEGILLLNMAVSGGALEFEYTLSDDKKTMELSNVGTDSSHTWTKQ